MGVFWPGFLAALLLPLGAAAQDGAVSLQWSAPPECPQAEQLNATIRRLLEGVGPSGDNIRATGRVVREGSGRWRWRLRLVTQRGEAASERVLEDASCEAIAEATALILALMIDPRA